MRMIKRPILSTIYITIPIIPDQVNIALSYQLSQINWPPEDYDPEDDEIAKVYTNGGKVSSHYWKHIVRIKMK